VLNRVVTLGVLVASIALSCAANARGNKDANWDAVAQGRVAGPPVLAVLLAHGS
jgi:hypothetical protein